MENISKKNKHIADYINYYASINTPIDYAIFINGTWGCGKTYLVDSCIKKLEKRDKNPVKFISVSLYGLKTISDIESKFFEILHPVLSNKKMILAGKFAKGILRGALRLDLDGDGTTDGSLRVGIPDIDLSEFFTNVEDTVLVFDDLERCLIPIKELLGYLNYFVEKEGFKVIVIGDETKIENSSDQLSNGEGNTDFFITKEKLIGKSFEVSADVDLVFDSLIESNLIKDSVLKGLFRINKEVIVNVFNKSKFNNLRILKRSVLDFERLWNILDVNVKEKKDLLQHFVIVYMVSYFEINSGAIRASNLKSIIGPDDFIKRVVGKDVDNSKENEESDENKNNDKYSEFFNFLYDPLLSIESWGDLIEKGKIDNLLINQSLGKSSYFYNENTDAWKKLWHFYELDDNGFNAILSEVKSDLQKKEYKHPGIMLHVIGIFVFLESYGLLKGFFKTNLFDYFKEYIDDISSDNSLEIDERPKWETNALSGYDNLGIYESDDPAFEKLNVYLKTKIKESKKNILKTSAKWISGLLEKKPEVLYTLLTHSDNSSAKYESTPILQYIPAKTFVKNFMSTTNKNKRIISDVIYHRYKRKRLSEDLIDEYKWLIKVVNLLKKEKPGTEETITYVALSEGIKRIEPGLRVLEHCFNEIKQTELV